MISFGDGTFYLEKGETVPFICPACSAPTEFDSTVTSVKCQCGHQGPREDFCKASVAPSTGH